MRQAGDLGGEGAPYEQFERVQRFCDEIADIQKRWDDRFPLKGGSFAEGYCNGRLWIALQGDWVSGADQYEWFCRINFCGETSDVGSAGNDVNIHNAGDGNGGNDKIVLVVNIDRPEGPQMVSGVVDGPYLIAKKFLGAGQGSLHLCQVTGLLKILPIFRDGEVTFCRRVVGSDDPGRKVVKCGAEIVDRISDDECERFWDWFNGLIDQAKRLGVSVGRDYALFNCQVIETGAKGLGEPDQFINVLIGPLGFEPRPQKHVR